MGQTRFIKFPCRPDLNSNLDLVDLCPLIMLSGPDQNNELSVLLGGDDGSTSAGSPQAI